MMEILGGKNSSKGNKYESVGSNGTKEINVERGNSENTTSANKKNLPRAFQRTGAEEQSVGENESKEGERHLAAPVNSAIEEPFVKSVRTGNIPAATDKKVQTKKGCNYAKGKWISDDHPLYSGYDCHQWLSRMWFCRLTQRNDFDYEKLRWQPKDCDMVEFMASKFLKRMQDKNLAFVGDSLGRQQFQSLMCMVTGGNETSDVADVGREYGLVKALGSARPDGWAYRFPIANTTISLLLVGHSL